MNAGLHDILAGNASSAPAVIFIVRHGATKMNNQTDMSEDRIRAWTDVPLVEEGRREARRAGLKLKGKGIQAIVASDLVRAKETAEIIGKIIGIEPEFSEKLRPWKLGDFTGRPTKEALPEIAKYVQDKPDEPVPQGESFNQFKARAFEGFADALEAYPEGLLIVTHHRDERLAEAWDAAGQPPDHSIDLKVFLQKGEPPGAIGTLKTSVQALRGNGEKKGSGDAAGSGGGGDGMRRNDNMPMMPGAAASAGSAERFRQKWAATGKMPAREAMETPAQERAETPRQEAQERRAGIERDNSQTLAHGRAIAGAKALHAVGHISEAARDRHIAKSQKAIGQRKPFGAFAP